MKKLVIPLCLSFVFLFSCGKDECSCEKKQYSYPDDSYPKYTIEDVDCPDGITEENPVLQFLPEPDNALLDYVITQDCS